MTSDICNKELLEDEKKYKSHRLVKKIEPSLKDVLEEHLVAGKGLAWHTVQVGVNSAEQDKLPLCKERDGGAWKQVVSDE